MKTIWIAHVLLILLSGCGNRPQPEQQNELLLTKQLCGQLQADLNFQISNMAKEIESQGNTVIDKKVLADSRSMASWRNRYLTNRNKANLIKYVDSLLKKYDFLKKHYGPSNRNIPSGSYRYQQTPDFVKALQIVKTEFENDDDTLNHVRLFYWSLKAERELLNENLLQVGYGLVCGKIFLYSELNLDEIKLGDSLYMMLPFDYFYDRSNGFYKFEPISFSLKNKATRKEMPLKVVQIGPRFIGYGTPTEKGDYEIIGKAKVQTPEKTEPDTLRMIQDFRVI